MRKLNLLSLALIIGLFFGCSDSSSSGNSGDADLNQSGQPMPTFGADSDADIGGVMATRQFNYEIPNSPIALPPIEIKMGFASFANQADAGAVSINNIDIPRNNKMYNTFDFSATTTDFSSLSLDVDFNGSQHSWNVAGKGSIPQINLSVASPSTFSFYSPSEASTVSKSDDLQIGWTKGVNSAQDSMLVLFISGKVTYIKQGLANTGSHTIPASELSNAGSSAIIQVVKYRTNTAIVDEKLYIAVSEIVTIRNIILQ